MKLPYSKIVNKYYKHIVLAQHEDIIPYLPDTEWFNKKNLMNMLEKFPVVFIKPSRGTAGVGIFRLEKKTTGFSLHYKKIIKEYDSFDSMYNNLIVLINQARKNSKRFLGKYIIQQGISLLKYNNRLFDIRSYVQFNMETEKFDWRGVLARVGHPNKIVTNISNSGMAISFEKVFRKLTDSQDELLEEIVHISTRIAESIHDACDEIVEVGLDFGVDEDFNLWLIEVNVKPRYNGFRKVDMELYESIDKRSQQLKIYSLQKKYRPPNIDEIVKEETLIENKEEGETT